MAKRCINLSPELPIGFPPKPITDEEGLFGALPDCLLIQFISQLPINEAVRTSCLSRRWRHLWKQIDQLIVKNTKESYVYTRFLSSLWVTKLQKMDINIECFNPYHEEYQVEKLANLASRLSKLERLVNFGKERKVEHLCFECKNCFVPSTVFTIETLKKLELKGTSLSPCSFGSLILLPRLQTLVLTRMTLDHEAMRTLLSKCLVLESLSIVDCKTWRHGLGLDGEIQASNLKNLRIISRGYDHDMLPSRIALPSLEFLELVGSMQQLNVFTLHKEKLVSLRTVSVHCYYLHNVEDFEAWSFLKDLSQVKVLKLRVNGSKVHERETDMPLFMNITSLELKTSLLPSSRSLHSICKLLSSSPHLEILKIFDYENDFVLDKAECWVHLEDSFSLLLTKLREVVIHITTNGSSYNNYDSLQKCDSWLEKKLHLVRILLSNSKTLEKLLIFPMQSHDRVHQVLWEPLLLAKLRHLVLGFSRASPNAEIIIKETT